MHQTQEPRRFRRLLLAALLAAVCITAAGQTSGVYPVPKRLVFTGDANYPPYEYLENGTAKGFNIELLQAVARVMNFEVEFQLKPWPEARRLLEEGLVDGITGYAYSREREQLVDYSVPHSVLIHGVFSREGETPRVLEDLKSRSVIVQEEEIMHDYLLESGLAGRVATAPDIPSALRLLASGEHDAVLANRYQGLFFCDMLGLSNLRVAPFSVSERDYCFAVPKGRRELLEQLNEGMRILKATGEYRTIYEKWLGVHERDTLMRGMRHVLAALLAALAGLAVTLVWIATLRRQVALRTAELAESERKHRLLIEGSPDAILVHRDGRIIFANPAACRMLHVSAPELLEGAPLAARLSAEAAARLERDSGGETGSDAAAPALEIAIMGPDGETMTLEASSITVPYPSGPALLTMLRDVTPRKRAEEALLREQSLVRTVAETSPVGILMVDTAGLVVFANDRMADLFGQPRTVVEGSPLRAVSGSLHIEEGGAPLETLVPRVAAQGEVVHNLRCGARTRTGGTAVLSLNGAPLEREGGERCAVFTLEDITAVVVAEEEKRRLEAQMLHAQKLESLGVLAGGVAHDFNNMLMAVIGNADIALMDVPPPSPAYKCILEIGHVSRRAADLCRQMLAYSGKGRFTVEAADINRIIRETGGMLKAAVSENALLRFRLAETLPAVEADTAQIIQVLMNLVMNASEALGGQKGAISVGTGVLQWREGLSSETWGVPPQAGAQYVWFEVSDTGQGMTPETVERVFDPFFSTKFTGRGLGLAAVLGIVRGHRGFVQVRSKPGQGSTFQVLLPL
ncbi:MAG: transporter substrate-binding domain-containing protein [Candidatus Hydrogenedentes bacterium]|nr:transporter substrate-binding domain-containing protein [Candidatus Hydrogenedentota bacterium]